MVEGLKNPSGSNSRPAKHFDTMIDHIVNYVYISQNEFNGAQAHSNFDTLLAPYIIGKDYEYVKQNLQRLIYNISYPLRSSFQCPFYNTSFDLIPPDHMKNEPVVIGGKTHESIVYGDMQHEMDIINSAFLALMFEGDAHGKPFTFPIPTYGITKDILNKNDGVMGLLYALSGKFGSPNFQNYIGSGNDPSDVRSMCCRLSLDIKKLKSRGLWNMGNKTGSLGVVTINLNHCSKNGEGRFLENIDTAYDLSVKELTIKHKYIMEAFDKGLLPFTKQYLDHKDPFRSFFHTIGDVAMNEACINMFESTIEFNQDFVIETLKHLRNRTDETTEETGILHNLEETPVEGASYRLAKLDKSIGLPTQGIAEPYLTNSTHCPVNTIYDWTAIVSIQEKFKKFYSGGTIMHGFLGNSITPKYAGEIIKYMANKTSIPYYNITPTYSICENHGLTSGNVPECPVCKRPNFVYSRVVGYLQPVQKWNRGKQEEFKERKMFSLRPVDIIDQKYNIDDVQC
jgi:ribonucleoside-triphosphate reductase